MLELLKKIQSFHDDAFNLLQKIQKTYPSMNVFGGVVGDSKKPYRDNCYCFAQHLLVICRQSVVSSGIQTYLQTINEAIVSLVPYKTKQLDINSPLLVPEEIHPEVRKLILKWCEIKINCQELSKNPEIFTSDKLIQELLMQFAEKLASDEFGCTPEIFTMAENELKKNKIGVVSRGSSAFFWLSLKEYFDEALFLAKMFTPEVRAERLAGILSELTAEQIAELRKYVISFCEKTTNNASLVATQSQPLLPHFTASTNTLALNSNAITFHPFVESKKQDRKIAR